MDYLERVKQLKRQWAETPEADTGMSCAKSAKGAKSPTGPGRLGVAQPLPPDHPPETEMELRWLIDHLADPAAFAAWFERLVEQTDPAEG